MTTTRVCSRCRKDIPSDMGHASIDEKIWCISCITLAWQSPGEKPALKNFTPHPEKFPKGEDRGKG